MNITQVIHENAQRLPHKKAVIAPTGYDACGRISYAHYTFEQFVQNSRALSAQLSTLGIKAGTRVLLFVKPSLEFPLLVFSLFNLGAVPVLMDPGVGRKNLLEAIAKVQPEILIGEPIVHVLRRIFRRSFASVRTAITTRRPSIFTSPKSLQSMLLKGKSAEGFHYEELAPDALAAIVYTSGATGIPKGVMYTHRMFYQQVHLLKQMLPQSENDVDLSCFPLFSLFAIAMGMTSVIPWLDATKPASADPSILLQHIRDQGATLASGSPAIWQRVADYCTTHNINIPSLHGIMMFGAPVSVRLHEMYKNILPNGTTYTPYGATESLPVSWISGQNILRDHAHKTLVGAGTCIGTIVAETDVRIIESSPGPLDSWENVRELPAYTVGEIIVRGEQVTQNYFANAEETAKAKIKDAEHIWHRIGDLGYKDDAGLLWFCGRKAHHVTTTQGVFYSVNCEAIFNRHPEVKRSALISHAEGKVAVVIEREDARENLSAEHLQRLRNDLLTLAKAFPHTESIDTFFLHKKFPVDCRHNIKIDRTFLGRYFASKPHLAF